MNKNSEISAAVQRIESVLWQLELAKCAAQNGDCGSGNLARNRHIPLAQLVTAGIVGLIFHLCQLLHALVVTRGQKAIVSQLRHENSNRTFIALHGECSTRTRHLLPPKFEAGPDPVYIVIGRSTASIRRLSHIFDPHNDRPDKIIIIPLSFRAFGLAWPCLSKHFVDGAWALSQTTIRPSFRDLCAIAFRIAQGATQAQWWHSSGLSPDFVLFGHTGLADTSQLEQAMQRRRTRTVHIAHGVSHGWNFAGISSVGLFRCAHDSRLAKRFPGYGDCLSLNQSRPARHLRRSKRWLVLTSYSHPMNAVYQKTGVQADQSVFDQVHEAAKRSNKPPNIIVWRPHPTFGSLPQADQITLQKAARDAGFLYWADLDPPPDLTDFDIVLTTPSTVALDALKARINPVILLAASLEDDHVYSKMSVLNPESSQNLGELISTKEFNRVWDEVGPSVPLTDISQIRSLFERTQTTSTQKSERRLVSMR